VQKLFAGTGVQLEFDRETVESEPFDSGEDAIDFAAENFGPLMMLQAMLEAQGTWTDVREQLAAIYDRRQPGEYLVVLGRKL
jgi:hypothetical protein